MGSTTSITAANRREVSQPNAKLGLGMNSSLKWILGCFVPHSFVTLRHRVQRRRAVALRRATVAEYAPAAQDPYGYEDSIAWLASQGLNEEQVRGGSIPEPSLDFVAGHLRRLMNSGPVTALHIGNFVGVSLAYIAKTLRDIDHSSIVMAVDPNIPHRGIEFPQNYATRLLSRYGLQRNCVMICGYSLAKNFSDDGGYVYGAGRLSRERYAGEAAGEETLTNLGRLLPRKVDCAFIDGNHDGRYLAAELRALSRLVRPGGLLVLDDVSEAWFEISSVFDEFKRERQTRQAYEDGRVGILVLD
jgi:predicted O-methyltransferase YrrM